MRCLLLFLWLLAAPSFAQITMWNATPVDPGTYELDYFLFSSTAHRLFDESGLTQDRDSRKTSSVTYTGFGWGVAPDVDLWLYTSLSPNDEPLPEFGSRLGGSQTDFALQARWRFLQDDDFSLAFIGGPLYQNSFTPGGPAFLAAAGELVLEKGLSDNLTFVGDAYYYFPFETTESTYHQFGADVALSWEATDWLNPVLEVNYFQALPTGGGSSESWAATLGTVIYPSEAFAIYLGYQFNFAGRNVEQYGSLITGLTASF